VRNGHNTYTLLDSGDFRKLELVGPYILDRPALQAIWRPARRPEFWQQADANYQRGESGGGRWKFHRSLPESWLIEHYGLTMKIQLTDFGHLGLFAEQGPNWDWIREQIKQAKRPLNVLNTFAYNGGSSLAAASAGARVVHVDAARGMVHWGKENARESGLADRPIRWLVDDVPKFIRREIRRGHKYDGIILDPPSFGRGPKGEVWKFENDLPPLLEQCRQLLSAEPQFILLSAHTPGFSPLALENLLADMVRGYQGRLCSGEMVIAHQDDGRQDGARKGGGRLLPSGLMARWESAVSHQQSAVKKTET
jgi:23S rRNA (cytosine1962-C5)-methyltransferase